MNRQIRRTLTTMTMTIGLSVVLAGAALAHECVNASTMRTNPGAGAQVVFDETTGEATMTKGLENRIARGIVDYETGEGFHGRLGFDFDGDGTVDAATWQVTPTGSIPQPAMDNGPACQGITDFETYYSECVGS